MKSGLKPTNVRKAMSALLVINGFIHLIVAAAGVGPDAPERLRIAIGVFGVVYSLLGVWVWGFRAKGAALLNDNRTAVRVTIAIIFFALIAGGLDYLRNGGPATLSIMFAFDVAALVCGLIWLNLSRKVG